MRRDLLFVAERLANLLDENRLNILTKLHGIRRAEEADAIGKLFTANLRRENESTLGRAVLESVMLHTASRSNAAQALREAATTYKVDTAVIAANVRQEFAAKDKIKASKAPSSKPPTKTQAKSEKSAAAYRHLTRGSNNCPAFSSICLPVFSPLCMTSAGRQKRRGWPNR
jgi:ParB family chromosome partitioning protein